MSAVCTSCRLSGADHWIGKQCPRCLQTSAMVRSFPTTRSGTMRVNRMDPGWEQQVRQMAERGGWRGQIVSGYRTREEQDRFWQGHITNAQIQADTITAQMIAANTLTSRDLGPRMPLTWRERFRQWRRARECRRSTALWGWR